jgi:hypothetical protein
VVFCGFNEGLDSAYTLFLQCQKLQRTKVGRVEKYQIFNMESSRKEKFGNIIKELFPWEKFNIVLYKINSSMFVPQHFYKNLSIHNDTFSEIRRTTFVSMQLNPIFKNEVQKFNADYWKNY